MVGGLQPPAAEEEEQERLSQGQGVIFVLEDAQLEVAQVGKVSTAHTYNVRTRSYAYVHTCAIYHQGV